MKKVLLFIFSLLHLQQSFCAPVECPEMGPSPLWGSFRYTSPRGVGYNHGYTTFEAFLSGIVQESYLPFLDARAHLFDNGKFAANGGLGCRYLSSSRIFGANAYYDYRNTKYKTYSQVGVGLETLGEIWDARINGYFPVGRSRSTLHDVDFYNFQGNSLYLIGQENFSLGGTNAEVGAHVDHFKNAPIYIAAGPYYLSGKGVSTFGGELRASVELWNQHLRIEGNTAYDHYYKWTGQGQISVTFPFGKKQKICKRLVQPVYRNEIIPTASRKAVTEAINPLTQEPYFFLFVDNLSSSLGTFESPYASLLTAQNNSSPSDVIYVFPGDGSTTKMNMGITLADYQMLLGSGSPQPMSTQYGIITIPPLSSSMPYITSPSPSVVITANGNTISGFNILHYQGVGIYGIDISNLVATNNAFYGNTAPTNAGEAILVTDASGTLNINGNTFTQGTPTSPPGYSVHIQQTEAQCSSFLAANTFYNSAVDGIYIDLSGTGSIRTLSVSDSSFIGSDSNTSVNIALADSSYIDKVNIVGVTSSDTLFGIQTTLAGSGSIGTMTVDASSLNFCNSGNCMSIELLSTGSINNLVVRNSDLSFTPSSGGAGLSLNMSSSGTIDNILIDSCTFISNYNYGIFTDFSGSGNISNFIVNNSTISSGSNGGGAGISLNLNDLSTTSVDNFTISNSTIIANAGTGFFFGGHGSGSIENLLIENSTIATNAEGNLVFNIQSTGSIENLVVTNCSLDNSSYGISAYLTTTGTISNWTVTDSSMNYASDYGFSLIQLGASQIDKMAFTGCEINYSHLGGFYIELENSGASIGTLSLDNSNVNYNNYGLIFYLYNSDALIENITITSSNFNHNQYGIAGNWYAADTTVSNITITDSNLNQNIHEAVALNLSYGTLSNLITTDCDMNDNGGYAVSLNVTQTGFVGTASFENCNFNQNTGNSAILFQFENTASMDTLEIIRCSFLSSTGGVNVFGNPAQVLTNFLITDSIFVSNNSPIMSDFISCGNFTITGCTITGAIANGGVLLNNGSIDTLEISNNTFSNNQVGIGIGFVASPLIAINSGTISNNTFSSNIDAGVGIGTLQTGCSLVLSITDNTFSSTLSPSPGFAANINTPSGTSLCLDFIGNTAPLNILGNAPYLFEAQTGSTFNLTSESTQANNTGTISESGDFGSCTQ